MPSDQFLFLLTNLQKISGVRQLPWQPVRRWDGSYQCDFRIALGDGIVRIESSEDDEDLLQPRYRARLTTRDGLWVDEVVVHQPESDHYPMLHDIFQQARLAAFDLSGLIDGMHEDLENGTVRELPEDNFDDSEFPF